MQAIERHRLLQAPEGIDDLDSINIPIACLEAMKWVAQDSSGIKATLETDGEPDYIRMAFPLDRDLSPCDGHILPQIFYMSTSEIAPPGKISRIGDFDSHLIVDKPIGDSTTPFVHFEEGPVSEGTAKYEFVFKVPLIEVDEQRASGFWTETQEGEEYFATTIYLGINYSDLVLQEPFLYL